MVTELQHHQESGASIIIGGGAIKRTIDSNSLINSCHYKNDTQTVLMLRSSSMSPTMMSPTGETMGDDVGSPGSNYEMSQQMKRKDIFTQRKQREFIPDAKKDDSYWDRRRRNNEAAKRSREKRRFNDMVLEQRVIELTKENHVLKAQLDAIKDKYNISGENLVSVDQILATLPTSEQVLSLTKRLKPNSVHSNGTNDEDEHYAPRLVTPKPTVNYTQAPAQREHQIHPIDSSQPPQIIYGSRQSQNSPFVAHAAEEQQQQLPTPQPQIIRVSPASQPQHLQASQQQQQQPVPSTPVITSLFKPLHPTNVQHQQQQSSPQQPHHQPHDLHKFILLNKNGESLNNNNNNDKKQSSNGVAVISNEKMIIVNDEKAPRESVFPHIQLTKFLTNTVKSNYISHHTFSHHLHHHHHHPAHHELETSSVLNLSRRTISNGSGSDIGNDNEVEHFGTNEYYNEFANNGGGSNGNQSDRSSTVDDGEHDHDMEHTSNGSTVSNVSMDHASLPLKLRHKTHFLGEKESAATALLALHNIKQEPTPTSHSHSPVWDGENSSDERDSGISIEHRDVNPSEWSNIQRKIIVNASTTPENFEQFNTLIVSEPNGNDRNIHLKSHLARLESEISTIKNMMILSSNSNSAPINA
ncbi:hypothetical protein PVAND_003763 [Polypedilum vanderplanki]|uniref:BZIP domain-containing protein n=1 Tax=Polypedilum vanderplanki TaxID=319348 RepID=A0A9J6BV14_POLVA|nr:hypothetical protein PVAND_003763 [Polypedilum vanderplanki]